MSGGRRLSENELDLWRRATADVKPLADIQTSESPPTPVPTKIPSSTVGGRKTASAAKDAKSEPSGPAALQALDPRRPVDIDRRTWERLKRGRIDIERKLDLHGRTQAEAHGALERFLAMASITGLRCVLVVTGKGGVDGRGVLRQMVPRWLGEAGVRDKVLTYCPAQPRHGGDGALYVLLKRPRASAGR